MPAVPEMTKIDLRQQPVVLAARHHERDPVKREEHREVRYVRPPGWPKRPSEGPRPSPPGVDGTDPDSKRRRQPARVAFAVELGKEPSIDDAIRFALARLKHESGLGCPPTENCAVDAAEPRRDAMHERT